MPSRNIGRLDFEFETFAFGSDGARQRPVKVHGVLSNFTSFPALSPLSHHVGGDTNNSTDPMEGYDKGHVIMVSHSGVSAPENIVPMYPCFNQAGGIWRELELCIERYTTLTLPSPGSPRVMDMTVEIKYEGTTDPRFPTAFIVTVKDNSAQGGFLYFKGAKLDKLRIPHLPTPAMSLDPKQQLNTNLLSAIELATKEIQANGWQIEHLFPDAKVAPLSHIPIRPYAMLDYLWRVKNNTEILAFLTTGCIYRHNFAAEFHERQKMLIRIINAGRNGNVIKSDYPGDTTESLIIGSGPRAAQIDHVYPYSQNGGNLFSNALIASGAYNNRMKAASPKNKWNDRSGATLYDTNRHM